YFGQVALSRMAPEAPPAKGETAVIVPVLGRPQNAAPFMESLKTSGAPLARVYAVADADDEDTVNAWKEAGGGGPTAGPLAGPPALRGTGRGRSRRRSTPATGSPASRGCS